MRGSVKHLNPEGLHKNPAYSQAVVTTGNVRTVYVSPFGPKRLPSSVRRYMLRYCLSIGRSTSSHTM
jgi:hypothetical protein